MRGEWTSLKLRPSTLDPQILAQLCEHLRKGLSAREACRRAGLSISLFRRWIHLSGFKGPGSEYRRFLDIINGARASAKARGYRSRRG